MTPTPLGTDDEFNARLRKLIQLAEESGIDVTGGWDLRRTKGKQDYTVEIFPVHRGED